MKPSDMSRTQVKQVVKFKKQIDFLLNLLSDIDNREAFWVVAPAALKGMQQYLRTLPTRSTAHREVARLAHITQKIMANGRFNASSGPLGRSSPTHRKAPHGMVSARSSGLPSLGKRR